MKHPTKAKVEDKSETTNEHMEAIRFHIARMNAVKQDETTRNALAAIAPHLDALEGKKA